MLNPLGFRVSLPLFLIVLSGGASAVGLGELRGQPNLGERLRLEIDLIGAEKQVLDAACFRLEHPAASDDLPWLKQAALIVRKGTPQVLEIRSESPLREPVLQVGVRLGCGHEVSRQYLLLASPGKTEQPSTAQSAPQVYPVAPPSAVIVSREARPRRPSVDQHDVPQRLVPRRAERRERSSGTGDRLLLSGGSEPAEPSLRLATELLSWRGRGAKEAQREILRLEFRMLMALNEQANTQMATAEKLRNMEETLGELQRRAEDFATRVESQPMPTAPPAQTAPAVPPPTVVPSAPKPPAEGGAGDFPVSEWSLYGLLLGLVLGLAGWLGWRSYSERQHEREGRVLPVAVPEMTVDPQRETESDTQSIDFHVEPTTSSLPTAVDVVLDGGDLDFAPVANQREAVPQPQSQPDSLVSTEATTVGEHFEANPVMELADIMLSFGRVKGAAQALQEYIDNNPQEALQPWIRLMEVYRLAGMRDEFESVARNLNQHFNVEVQSWEASASSGEAVSPDGRPSAASPVTLEDMPRIMEIVCRLWQTGDVVGYLYQLLRDNRGGKRAGFALSVVEEILFLIELKETSNRF